MRFVSIQHRLRKTYAKKRVKTEEQNAKGIAECLACRTINHAAQGKGGVAAFGRNGFIFPYS